MANEGKARDAWRGRAANGSNRRAGQPRSRGWIAAGFVVAFLVGLIVAAFVFLGKEPEPIVLALPIAEYHKFRDRDWPTNPWAENDAHALRDPFGVDSAQAFQHQERSALLRELESTASRNDSRRPLLVYLNCLGTVRGDDAFLLPADATPYDPTTWLKLDDILGPLRKATGSRALILDVRPVLNPRVDLATNDVNVLLERRLTTLSQANDLPFPVLLANTSCAGPVVLTAQRNTLFGLALRRGMNGAADGWNPKSPRDGIVTFRELADYAIETTRIVSDGPRTQTPILFGPNLDFTLKTVGKNPPEEVQPEAPVYPEWLALAWKDREQARMDRIGLRAPRALREQGLAARRAERAWIGGADAKAIQDREGRTLDLFRKALPEFKAALPPHLPGRVDVKEKLASTALRPLIAFVQTPEFAKTPALLKEEIAKAKLPPDFPYAASVAVLWNALRDDPSVERVKPQAMLMEELPNAVPVAEAAYFKLLAEVPVERMKQWPKETLRDLLDALGAAEAFRRIDTEYAWSSPEFEKESKALEESLRKALAGLCDPNLPDAEIGPAAKELPTIREKYRKWFEIRAARERLKLEVLETRAVLSDLADGYPHDLLSVQSRGALSLASSTDKLLDAVRKLASPNFEPEAERRTASLLRDERLKLLDPIVAPNRDDAGELASALDWPNWNADARKKLVDRQLALENEALARWPKAPSGRNFPVDPKRGEGVRTAGLRDLKNRIEILGVAESPNRDELRDRLRTLGEDNAAFDKLAGDVQREWRVRLVEEFKTKPERRAEFGWAVEPDDMPALPSGPATANPEWDRHRADFERLTRTRAAERILDAERIEKFAPKSARILRDLAQASIR